MEQIQTSALMLIEEQHKTALLETVAWMESVKSITVTTPEESLRAKEVKKICIEKEKALAEDKQFAEAPYSGPLNTVRNTYNSVIGALGLFKAQLAKAYDDFDREQERKARAEQARLEAEKQAKIRAAQEEERKAREAAEAAQKAAEEAIRRAQEATDEETRKKALAEAETAQKAISEAQDAAQIAQSEAVAVETEVVPFIAPQITKGGRGTAVVDRWYGEIIDPLLFKAYVVKAIADTVYDECHAHPGRTRQEVLAGVHRLPEFGMFDVDEKALNQFAKRFKQSQTYPGARIYSKRS